MARVNLILAVLAAILLVAATLIITWMVFKRGIGLQSSWELETAIELMIGATFLASPYTLVTGTSRWICWTACCPARPAAG